MVRRGIIITAVTVIATTLIQFALLAPTARAQTKVLEAGYTDPRLTNVRTLNQGSNFKPYEKKDLWQRRAEYLRQQVLVAAGLWPMPEKTPLNPVVRGRIDRGDYTVEKVYFESHPGFFVTGNLYRPKGKSGKFPAVLSPHGHWANGRLYEASDRDADRQLKTGEEKHRNGAKFPLQARAANLAKMGCVVFFYDMVGYADASEDLFPHRKTFIGPEYDLNLLSVFGLQTWNSIRAMDFLLSLPDVDPERIACTGASGGGTQTFVMMAVDDRLKVAAPVCMISHDYHQGGCVCENNALLRLGTDNVELSATFAPGPFVHPTATGDWTKAYLEHGYPETKAIYGLFGAEENVHAVRYDAGHNYNVNSREAVYDFFNKHLKLGQPTPVAEQDFQPVAPKELRVWDEQHPRPKHAVNAEQLKAYLIDAGRKQIDALKPTDAKSLAALRETLGAALIHMLGTRTEDFLKFEMTGGMKEQSHGVAGAMIVGVGGVKIPVLAFAPLKPGGPRTVIVHPKGKDALLAPDGSPGELVKPLLDKGHVVLVPDVFMTGELKPQQLPPRDPKLEFFPGYNRTTLGNRVHDILAIVAFARGQGGDGARVNLLGVGEAGTWVLLAKAIAGDAVARTAVDHHAIDFAGAKTVFDDNFVPGASKYGGLATLGALAAPGEMLVNDDGSADLTWVKAAYQTAGAGDKLRVEQSAPAAKVVEWLMR